MTEHKYGPKGHILDAFIEHLKTMTRDDWEPIFNFWLCTFEQTIKHSSMRAMECAWKEIDRIDWALAGQDVADVARRAVVRGDVDIAGRGAASIAFYAGDEILGSGVMRERGYGFFFLPMFGFSSEQAIIKQEQL
jgi:hypothetical protein